MKIWNPKSPKSSPSSQIFRTPMSPTYSKTTGSEETVERVLEGLLDGNLTSEPEDVDEQRSAKGKKRASSGYDVSRRRNLIDDQELDVTRPKLGKRDVGYIIIIILLFPSAIYFHSLKIRPPPGPIRSRANKAGYPSTRGRS